ncbi:NADH-quinone oxidoreductase subunit M [Candidatus Vallotia lariciata]|uniref:NADH-quinone oxidoreductase subunit M n=1 Tax=Candidatus Vallotia laricis TaxID=2018052 RepID=UPI001D016B32|nr:NADH-quinone oxidoreductase subunit M [Candidatus Vallotia lariciata]UDG82947.1 NADH-quinone oxidoreductase subunit M [Candidatus Vallotia lariciata]
MHAHFLVLTLAIWMPITFGIAVLVVGAGKTPGIAGIARWTALIGSVLSFIVTLPLIIGFNSSTSELQFVEILPWIACFKIMYHLGVDGISVWFVVLTAFITVLVVISGWEAITDHVAQYMAAFLILSGFMVGVFSAADGMLLYVFFEATLIPMYLIIGIWGGKNRVYAAFKFFLYTLAGSLLMLVALIYLHIQSQSFELSAWHILPLRIVPQVLLFVAFFLGFAVKVPMWPLHTWLPDAHVEAPTGGSVVLAAIMLKLGAYGFIRLLLPITPDASRLMAPVMITLSLFALIYIGFVALVQTDIKKLVAYSSIAHMGFVTLGLFLFSQLSVEGAIVQMLSHSFVSGAMFLCIGVLYERMHSRQITDYGGVVNTMPKFVVFATLFAMANCALPGTSGFVGEFMVILSAIKFNFWIGFLAAITLILGAAYTLWMVKRVYFGAIKNDRVAELVDLNVREFLVLTVLALLVLYMGIFPKPFMDLMHESVINLLSHLAQSKLPATL